MHGFLLNIYTCNTFTAIWLFSHWSDQPTNTHDDRNRKQMPGDSCQRRGYSRGYGDKDDWRKS